MSCLFNSLCRKNLVGHLLFILRNLLSTKLTILNKTKKEVLFVVLNNQENQGSTGIGLHMRNDVSKS